MIKMRWDNKELCIIYTFSFLACAIMTMWMNMIFSPAVFVIGALVLHASGAPECYKCH